MILTQEFVTPFHPDKVCDRVADTILDEYMRQDNRSRVAVELLAGHGTVSCIGEITSMGQVDIPSILNRFFPDFIQNVNIQKQSPEIQKKVDTGGAGDQGIMTGYATASTSNLMPDIYNQARSLCEFIFSEYPRDGKVQVTYNDDTEDMAIVASFNSVSSDLLEKRIKLIYPHATIYANPGGDWSIGSFEADTGLTGRKIAIDNYGSIIPIGGGSFSGKDPTKVDRSAAYMARKIAVDRIKSGAEECTVRIAYAIGMDKPIMAINNIDGRDYPITDYDLRPHAIIEFLQLDQQEYYGTSEWGHFGKSFIWDKLKNI